jgi:hypothetical protein
MFEFPSSNVMDAVTSTGGPGTFLPEIITGAPERIARHSTGLFGTAGELAALHDEFGTAKRRLDAALSSRTAQSAGAKLADALAELRRITTDIEHGAALISVAGTLVASAQLGYRLVLSEINPLVAELVADPRSRRAGVALAELATDMLRAFLDAVEEWGDAIGGDLERLSEDTLASEGR